MPVPILGEYGAVEQSAKEKIGKQFEVAGEEEEKGR